MRAVQIFLFSAVALCGQDDLLDAIRITPPEVHADLLLQLLASPSGRSKAVRIELLEEAFETAANAQERLPLRQPEGGTDSLSGSVRRAFAKGLDRVSLQARAVTLLATLDPTRAARLGETIVIGDIPTRPCADRFEYDFTHFYAMKRVVPVARTPQHIAELAPYLEWVAKLPREEDRAEHTAAAAALLQRASPDWHGLLAALDPISYALPVVAASLPQTSRSALAAAFRGSVSDHLAIDWCRGTANREPPEAVLRFYQQSVTPISEASPPLTRKAVKGSDTGVGMTPDRFWQGNHTGAKLHARLVELFLKTDAAAKDAQEWRNGSNQLYDGIRAWDGADLENKTQYFLEKCLLYRYFATLSAAPQGPFQGVSGDDATRYLAERKQLPALPERQRAVEDLVAWLDSSTGGARVYEKRRIEWLGPVITLLAAAEGAGLDKQQLSARFLAANHPVLNAYGKVLLRQ